jgi:medium-chain acyl-[acyl-carrier-protein] hydrolase
MSTLNQRIAALPEEKRNALLRYLKQAARPESLAPSAWVLRYRPREQARLRLFCFPYAGGRASIFRPWAEVLPSEIELCSIQLPGREERIREQPYTRLAPLVQALSEAMMPYLDRPFAFYGHSMGALIAFAVALRLRAVSNLQPVALHLAAFRAPQVPSPHSKIFHLPEEVLKAVLRADGIPAALLQHEEVMQALLPTLRADYEVCDTYEYQEEPPLDCPFYLYGGREDVRVREADMAEWPMHTTATSHFSLLPGSHLFLHTAQDRLLAEIIQHLGISLASSFPV